MTRFTVVLCVGLLALLAGPWGARLLSPGALAAAHGTVVDGCAACHAVARTSPVGWFGTGLGHPSVPAQAELCLACHNLGPFGRLAHGVDPVTLTQHAAAPTGAPFRAGGLAALVAPPEAGEAIACAGCHREHQGRRAALTAIADDRCQACHRERFTSLGEDHPEFSQWPSADRDRITFDHVRHEREHFADKSEPFECSRCHEPDARGAAMRTGSFERSCAACHDDQLRGLNLPAGGRGVAFLGMPALAAELRTASARLAAWPEGPGLRRSAFVSLLLAGDPSLSDDDLAAAGDDASSLGELGDDADASRRALEAWLDFLDALAERGPQVVRERVAATAGRDVSAQEEAALTAGLPRETVLEALAAWRRAPSSLSPAPPSPEDRGRERFSQAGGWYRRDADRSLRYRPAGHADPFLRAWIELAAEIDSDAAPPRVRRAARALARDLARPASPGQCALCHRLGEEQRRAGAPVAWAAPPESGAEHPATRFAHRPHLSLLDRDGCGTCHRAVAEPEDLAAPASAAFEPMTRSLCATCHHAGAAADACTTCHSYHRGSFAPALADAGLRRAATPVERGVTGIPGSDPGPLRPEHAPTPTTTGADSGDELLE